MQEITALRRDKLTAIIGTAHAKLARVVIDAGVDPAIARMVAAARVYHMLPPAIRAAMSVVESEVAERFGVLFRDVSNAGIEELKKMPTQ